MQKKYSISIVNYTNTLPFRYGLIESGLAEKIDLHFDVPSECARKLLDGTVDIGLVPVAILPEMNEYHIISNYCLGSNGAVDTVKLYSRVPLEEIETIHLDYQSRTSVTLVQVLSLFYWKIAPEFVAATEGFESRIAGKDAAVVIGDRCFDLNGKFEYEYDLPAEWNKHTGMPFVFAAWVSNKPLEKDFIQSFEGAMAFGLVHIDDAVEKYVPQERRELVRHYLTQRIDYHFTKDKQKAMLDFLNLLHQVANQG